MLLICDFCNAKKREIIKLPNAFIIHEMVIEFPNDPKLKYTNICLDCMGIDRSGNYDL